MSAALRDDTAALIVSTVLFETAAIVPQLAQVTAAARSRGAAVLYDAYHAFTTVPFRIADLGPDPIFLVAGVQICAVGKASASARAAPDNAAAALHRLVCRLFGARRPSHRWRRLLSEESGARFAGSTFDPVSLYRARAVCSFFDVQGLTVPALRRLSLSQTDQLIDRLSPYPQPGCRHASAGRAAWGLRRCPHATRQPAGRYAARRRHRHRRARRLPAPGDRPLRDRR